MSELTTETYIKSISRNKAGFRVVSYGKSRTSQRESVALYKQLKDLVDEGERFQVKIGGTYMTDKGVDTRSQLNASEMKQFAGQHFVAQVAAEGVDPSNFPQDVQDFMTDAASVTTEEPASEAGAAVASGGAGGEEEEKGVEPPKPKETREQILKRMSEARAEAEIEEAEERITEEAKTRKEKRELGRETTRERKEQEAEMEVGRSRPAEQPEGPREATKPGRALRGRGGAGGPGAPAPTGVQRDEPKLERGILRAPPAEQPEGPRGATKPGRALRGRGGAGGPGAPAPTGVQRDEPELEGMSEFGSGASTSSFVTARTGPPPAPGPPPFGQFSGRQPAPGHFESTRPMARRPVYATRRLISEEGSQEPVPEPASAVRAVPPPGPPPQTVESSVVPVPEADAKKALAEDPQPSLDPSTEVKLIGPDSAKEMKEANIIYKDAFRMVFSDRSGVRELERFKASEEAKQAESKTPDALFMEADDVRRVYEDQMKIARLVFNVVDEKKDLEAQWNELNVLAKGTNENLKGKPNQDVLGQFNSVGVVVDISNLGMNLQDFMNYINARNLTNKTDKQKGNNKLSGFQKGVNLEDVEPEEPPKPDPPTIEPIPTTKALADPAQEVGVFGKPEFISNERVKGVINVSGFKKPVKKDKSKRVVIML